VTNRFWPMAIGPDPSVHLQGYVTSVGTGIMLVGAVSILVSTAARCVGVVI
jgi:hypothetical protein